MNTNKTTAIQPNTEHQEIGRALCRKGYARSYCDNDEQREGWDAEHFESESKAANAKMDRDLSPPQINTLLRLRNGEECEIHGVTWMRIIEGDEDEYKLSPHADLGDYDTDCRWISAEDLRAQLASKVQTKRD